MPELQPSARTDGQVSTSMPTSSADLEARLARARDDVRAYLRRLGARADDLDDLTQDVLTRCWTYRRHEPPRDLRAFLRTTAMRVWVDHRARAMREARPLGDAVTEHALPDGADSDAREEVERVLARLEPIERQVLLAFHARGESIAAIAAAFAMPTGTVKSHLHRARSKLAEERR